MTRNRKLELFYLALFISIACLFIFYLFIFDKKVFALNSDQILQYRYFYEEYLRLLKSLISDKTLPMYSFNSFLGSDFYASFTYYVVGDFLIPLAFLFKKIDHFLLFETIFCVYLSAFSFNCFLNKFKISDANLRIWASILYACSGFATLFYGQYMFHRFYSLMPLVFYGIERFFKEDKRIFFSISIALLFITNYYLMFPLSLLLPFYCLFSLSYHQNLNFKSIKKILKLILFYFIGIALSAFIVLPSFKYILNNPRIGSNDFSYFFFELQVYVGFIFNWTSFFLERWIFENAFVAGYNGHLSFYSFYFGGLAFISALSLFVSKKIKSLVFLLIPFIFLALPKLNSIVHGFSEPSLRWSFILVFLMILISAISLENINHRLILKTLKAYLFISFFSLLLFSLVIKVFDIKHHLIHLIVIVVFLVILVIEYLLFKHHLKSYLVFSALMVVVVASLGIRALNYQHYDYQDDLDKDVIKYLKDINGSELFRIYVNPDLLLPSSTINLNQSLHYDFMSFHTYNTTYETSIQKFLKINGNDLHIIRLDDEKIRTLLAEKYYIVDDLTQVDLLKYQFVSKINHLNLYQKIDYLPIAFSFNDFVYEQDINDYQSFDWLKKLIVPNDFNYSKYLNADFSKLTIIYRNNNYIKGEVKIKQPSVLFIALPYNDGWKIKVNGQFVDILKVNHGFMGIVLDDVGLNEIEMVFITPYLKEGLVISGFVSLGLVFYFLYKKIKK